MVFSGAIGREAEERPGNMRPYRRFGRALAARNTVLGRSYQIGVGGGYGAFFWGGELGVGAVNY